MVYRLPDVRLFKSILAGFLGCTVILFVLFNANTTSFFGATTLLNTGHPSISSADNPCCALPGADDVLVVVKTGATALRERLPVHFETTLKCIPHCVIFSDLEEEFEGQHIHDVLTDVSDAIKQSAPEFEYYRELHRNRNRIAEFTAMHDSTDFRRKAWDLDKWKFIPSVQRALHHKPDAKWLMFIECDSFLIWSNLLHWVAQLDSTKPYFLGLPVTMHEQLFAYGGAGWLLSGAAAEQMARHVALQKDGYESFTNGSGYGDLVLGHVLERAGVPLTGAWPVIQRETPSTMEYTSDVMCRPVVTFHHVRKADIKAIWDLEQEWIASRREVEAGPQSPPLIHIDIFTHLVYPHLTTRIDDWDNFSDGEEKALSPGEGFDKCKWYCEQDELCVQFRFTSTHKTRKCTLSNSITLGWQAAGNGLSLDQERSVSGWMMERIDQIRESVLCERAKWTSIINQ